MSRDPELFLHDILDACAKIGDYVRGVIKEELRTDSMRLDAVVRNLEMIGEAARQLPEAVRDALPDQPWSRIIGMRNILAHVYFALDLDIIWSTATTKVPELKRAVRKYLADQDEDQV